MRLGRLLPALVGGLSVARSRLGIGFVVVC